MLEEQRYYSFLLRAWRSGPDGAPAWRVSLEDVRTGERCAFASLAQAFAFLEGQIARPADGIQAALQPPGQP